VWTAITLQKFRNKPDHKQACTYHNPVRAGIEAVTRLRSAPAMSKRLNAPEHDKHDNDEQHEPEAAAAIVAGAIEGAAAEAAEASQQRNDKNDDQDGS
jgi:hypothetical protein